ncbi:hypothetical protein F3157_22540 [Virgibacillus dakarensis]|uniref:Uncharacterized protein n=1 Tax=Lentibacillus populi TaxID=1827502 RepID=A0A9W5X6I1_9BACI|nr:MULTISPECIES: hypothetical protein [Bacillaceae]MBT2216539.1 hypothetical protein [Virgibacillus dakarensis]MTW88355.1 hypothetical protein [Virgibacillus dakarensis]GGB52218.1 hypothetical protein GCM10011409_32230 [Lentibacillus populi]
MKKARALVLAAAMLLGITFATGMVNSGSAYSVDPGYGDIFSDPGYGDIFKDPGYGDIFSDPGYGDIFNDPGYGDIF